VIRRGINGPITLKVADAPPGLIVRPGTIADGQLIGSFTIATTADATIFPVALNVVGEAQTPNGPIVVEASKVFVFATQATLPTNTQRFLGLTATTVPSQPLTIETQTGPFEVAHGYGTSVPVKVVRQKDATGALAITSLPLPPGLTIPAANVGEKAEEVAVTVNTAVEHPLGNVSVALVAKGKVGGFDRTFGVPAITLNVVKPAVVELASANVDLKAGGTAEIKGKVTRKGAFKEPVTVKLNGLPAGTKAEPVTLAADKSEFTIKLTAEEKAAPATASASAALAFQVNKKDYPNAPTTPLSIKVLPSK